MPRNMSFSITTRQFVEQNKTVTRRLGWDRIKVGDIVQGVEKGMGLKKGEKVKRLGLIRIVSVRREPLDEITRGDCWLEGFGGMSPKEFVDMFCKANRCDGDRLVNRIEFDYCGPRLCPICSLPSELILVDRWGPNIWELLRCCGLCGCRFRVARCHVCRITFSLLAYPDMAAHALKFHCSEECYDKGHRNSLESAAAVAARVGGPPRPGPSRGK